MKVINGKNYPFGIHVKDNKSLCREKPIIEMPQPKTVSISLSQHIGSPAEPIVEKGDMVKRGQLIAKESGFVSANIYASISGVVKDIVDIRNGLGQLQKHIVIEKDESDNTSLLFEPMVDFTPSSLIERIRLAGIVGLGGAGFPTAVKLMPKNQLEYLIINGAECEPYLNCDYRLMVERTLDIYKGIKYVAKALNINKIYLGIEKNKPEAIELFSKFDDIQVVALKKQYPMGSEKHLIYCTIGKKVPIGKMPFDVGACVQNIKTMIACYEAIELNKPLTDIIMTVSGNGVSQPNNIKVPIGTAFKDIADFCGGLRENTVKLVAGGPMMGKALCSINHFARKTDSGFLALIDSETNTQLPTNCINCSTCANNCPMRLMPMYIEKCALSGDFAGAKRYGAMYCIECGSCAYNCPAKRPLVQSITLAKAKIKEMK